MAGFVGAGDLDRCRTGVVCERGRTGEPASASGPPDETACGDSADTNGARQGAARGCDTLVDLLGIGLEESIDGADLGDQAGGDLLTDPFDVTGGVGPCAAARRRCSPTDRGGPHRRAVADRR